MQASIPFTDFIDISRYETINNQGNNPIILDDDNEFYMVAEGAFHLFIADSKDGEIIGRRNYLFSLFAGDIAFGIPPAGGKDKKITFFAIGVDESKMVRIPTHELPSMLKKDSTLRLGSHEHLNEEDVEEIKEAEIAAEKLKTADLDTENVEAKPDKPDLEDIRIKFISHCIKVWTDKLAYIVKTGTSDDMIPVSEMDVNLLDYIENGLLVEFNS